MTKYDFSKSSYVIFTQEPRGVTSRKVCRHPDLFQSLEEARRKSQLPYVEKAVLRKVHVDGTMSLVAEFVKGRATRKEQQKR